MILVILNDYQFLNFFQNINFYKPTFIITYQKFKYFFFRAKAKDPAKRIGDYEETQEDYEIRLEKQKVRQKNLREAETAEQHELRKTRQLQRQKNLRENETDEKKALRKEEDSEYKAYFRRSLKHRGVETNDEWNTRLDKQLKLQRKYNRELLPDDKKKSIQEKETIARRRKRDDLSEDKKATIRVKDNESKKKRRDADRPTPRPFTEKEKEYLKPQQYYSYQRSRRLLPLHDAGSYIKYLLDTLQENIKENGDWKWIYNTKTKETIMASEFQTLAKKYAVAFLKLGLTKGDVVHFFIKSHDYAHAYPALAGLWIIGAIGSFGNSHKWTNTHEKYQAVFARGKERYTSELELQHRQVCDNKFIVRGHSQILFTVRGGVHEMSTLLNKSY